MSRNSSGNYTLPLPPVVPGTLITAAWANATLNDIAQALTDSLDRNGRGGMNAPFRIDGGTEALPGLAFTGGTTTGLYSTGPAQMGVSILGTKVAEFTSAGITLVQPATFAGGLAVPPGTVAAPGLAFSDNADTGLYEAGADVIGFAVGGAQRMVVGAGGVLVNQGGNDGQGLQLLSGAANKYATIGVGRLATEGFLGVVGQVNNAFNGTAVGDIVAGATSQNLWVGTQAAANIQFVTAFNTRMTIDPNGFVGIGIAPSAGAKLLVGGPIWTQSANPSMAFIDTNNANYNWALQNAGGAFRFIDNIVGQVRMQIDSAGRVGIGVAPGGSRLEVGATTDATNVVGINVAGNGRAAFVVNASGTAAAEFAINESGATDAYGLLTGAVGFHTFGAVPLTFGTSNVERMRLDSAGRVGIGRVPTTFPLEVQGAMTTFSDFGAQGPAGQILRFGFEAWTANGCFNCWTQGPQPITFGTNTAQRMAIDGNGRIVWSNNTFARFESAEMACPTATGVFGANHGNPRVPDIWHAVLRCKVAEHGWSVGHEIVMKNDIGQASKEVEYYAFPTADVGIVYTSSAGAPSIRNTSGNLVTVTAANWRLVFRAVWLQ